MHIRGRLYAYLRLGQTAGHLHGAAQRAIRRCDRTDGTDAQLLRHGLRFLDGVTMPGYVEVMLTKYEVKLTQKYPTNGGLFVRDDNAPPLVETLRAEFHSRVYAVAYMVQRIKPECLPIVSEQCPCVRTATVEDWYKLEHLLQYINGTKNIGITIRIPRGPLFVNASVESSHGCHPNMRGHGAGTISISRGGSGGTIHSESCKLSLNTKSTAETELVTASDYGSQALFIGGFLREQGYANVTIILVQDNESTIALIRKGRSTAQATRHIAIRYFWLHDRLKGVIWRSSTCQEQRFGPIF